MGNSILILPFTYFSFLLGSLAIMGFPFLAGFYSKDILLEFTFIRYFIDSSFIYFFGVLTAFFTAAYSFKLIFYVFLTNVSNSFLPFFKRYEDNVVEDYLYLFIPIFSLSFLSIFSGYFFSEIFLGIGTDSFLTSIFVLPFNFNYLDDQFISPYIMNLPIICSFVGFLFSYFFFNFIDLSKNYFVYNIFTFFSSFFYNAFFFNHLYNSLFLSIYKFSYQYNTKLIDKGIFEWLGPYGIYLLLRKLSVKGQNLIAPFVFFLFFLNFLFLLLFTIFIIWMPYDTFLFFFFEMVLICSVISFFF